MNYPQNKMIWGGTEFMHIWIKGNSMEEFQPYHQVYGICFNDKNEILICKSKEDGPWQIAGGHPEGEETIEETLIREYNEEVDVKVKNIQLLGAQLTYPISNPERKGYQIRCICEVQKLLPQTPDPASGNTWIRKFVPMEDVTKYVQWQVTGDTMFADAIELWKKTH
jgi:ADP-ribose pyrophosphatase YjhB (NUDIX family)